MPLPNSTRIFLSDCPDCDGIEIIRGTWKVEGEGPEAGVLDAWAVCTECPQTRDFIMEPEATGCNAWTKKVLRKLKLVGTPYSVIDCGPMPYTLGN